MGISGTRRRGRSRLLLHLHTFGAADVPILADVELWAHCYRGKLAAWLAAAREQDAFPARRLDRVGESVRKSLWALDQARAESKLAYHRLFESSFYEPWIRALAGD